MLWFAVAVTSCAYTNGTIDGMESNTPIRPGVSTRQHTTAYVSIRQHTTAYVSIRHSLRQQTYTNGILDGWWNLMLQIAESKR